jgi:hypothetical protein
MTLFFGHTTTEGRAALDDLWAYLTGTGALPPDRQGPTLADYLFNNADFEVEDFGARADGTDAGPAINDALQAAKAAGGGRVIVRARALPYTIGTQLLIPSGVEFVGIGRPVLQRKTNFATPVLIVNEHYVPGSVVLAVVDTNIWVHGLVLDGNKANQTKIPFVDPPHVSLELSQVDGYKVTDIECKNSSDDGLAIELSQHGLVDNLLTHDNAKSAWYMSGCESFVIGTITSYNNGIGGQLSESWYFAAAQMHYRNNGVVGGTQAGLLISRDCRYGVIGDVSSSHNIGSGVIINPSVPGAGTRHGVTYDGVTAYSATELEIGRLVASHNGSGGLGLQKVDGIRFGNVSALMNQTDGVAMDGCQGNTFVSLKANNNSQVGAGLHAGLRLSFFGRPSSDNVFESLEARDTQTSKTQARGVFEDISGGDVSGNIYRHTNVKDNTIADWVLNSENGVTAVKTANYTSTRFDHLVRGDTTAGAFTITLTTKVARGHRVTVKLTAGVNILTVQGESGTIEGLTSIQWAVAGQSETFIFDGTNYVRVDSPNTVVLTVANNATGTIPTGPYATVEIADTGGTGETAEVVITNGGVSIRSQTGASFTVVPTTPSKTNFSYSAGNLVVENKIGATTTYKADRRIR